MEEDEESGSEGSDGERGVPSAFALFLPYEEWEKIGLSPQVTSMELDT